MSHMKFICILSVRGLWVVGQAWPGFGQHHTRPSVAGSPVPVCPGPGQYTSVHQQQFSLSEGQRKLIYYSCVQYVCQLQIVLFDVEL